MTTSVTKQDLSHWLSKSRMNRVVAALRAISMSSNDADFKNAILLHTAQWSDWQRAQTAGTLSVDELAAQRNRLMTALMRYMDELPDKNTYEVPTEILEAADKQDRLNPSVNTVKSKWIWIALAGLAAVVIGIFISQNVGFKTFTQTILVRDKKNDLILQNQGKVVLESKFGIDSVAIRDNGEATLNLMSNFIGEHVRLRISHGQPYQVVNADTDFVFQANTPIKLVVELRYLDKIVGAIVDQQTGNPLDSVRVSIQNVAAFTDKNGWFELPIPPDKQAKFQNIALSKKGYHYQMLNDVPVHTKKELNWAMAPLKK